MFLFEAKLGARDRHMGRWELEGAVGWSWKHPTTFSPCEWTFRAQSGLQDGNQVRRGRMAASGAVSGIVGECPMVEGDDDDGHGIP